MLFKLFIWRTSLNVHTYQWNKTIIIIIIIILLIGKHLHPSLPSQETTPLCLSLLLPFAQVILVLNNCIRIAISICQSSLLQIYVTFSVDLSIVNLYVYI